MSFVNGPKWAENRPTVSLLFPTHSKDNPYNFSPYEYIVSAKK
jgi:hypothetical protein